MGRDNLVYCIKDVFYSSFTVVYCIKYVQVDWFDPLRGCVVQMVIYKYI